MKEAFTIREGKDGKSRWVKIGVAFDNKDGSLNILLDAVPLDGKIHVREGKKREDAKPAAEGYPMGGFPADDDPTF